MNMLEEKVLGIIEKNSRVSTREVAVVLGTDEIDIINALQTMEEKGIICGYHTMIDWDKTDREYVTAMIEIKITPQRDRGYDYIAQKIYNYPEVETLYLMSGGFDLAVFIKGRTMREVAFFVAQKLATLEDVVSTATHFVLRKYKDNNVVYGAVPVDERGNEF
jgi:Transcriptional regulators